MVEPLCAHEEIPGLDAGGHDPLRKFPRVAGETVADVSFAWGVCDQQDADAAVFGAGEWPGEEDEAFRGEGVHERGVVAGAGLLEGAFPVGPGRPGIAGDRRSSSWRLTPSAGSGKGSWLSGPGGPDEPGC